MMTPPPNDMLDVQNAVSQVLSLTKRNTLQAGAALAVASFAGEQAQAGVNPVQALRTPSVAAPQRVALRATVNGKVVAGDVDARTSLLDLLREGLGLTGTKKGCDHGQCGACTVHIGGKRVVSCLTMAAKVNGREVLTIEGLPDGTALHPMQQAFIDHDALQCGYCTPGQIMAAVACVQEGHATSKADIKRYMSGNLCRCGAYVGIVAAIEDAASRMAKA